MKKIFFFIFFFFTCFQIEANNLAFVDINLIMTKSIAGVDIEKKILQLKKKRNTKISKAEKIIKTKESDLLAKKNLLNEKDFQAEVAKLKLDINKFNVMRNEQIETVNKKVNDYQIKLLKSIKPILTTYSEQKNISILLQKKNIILGDNSLDITNDIIKIVNKDVKKIDLK